MKDKYEIALNNLNCSKYSSLEEIKSSFRYLSKKYHPDINKNNTNLDFINIKESYDFIIKNFKPNINEDFCEKYYRYLEKQPWVIKIPFIELTDNIEIYCMYNYTEFKIHLIKGTKFPLKISINNIDKYPIEMSILPEKGYDYE